MKESGTSADKVQRRADRLQVAGFVRECTRQASQVRDAGQGDAVDDEILAVISDVTGWTE